MVDWWIGGRVANGAYENSNRAKHRKTSASVTTKQRAYLRLSNFIPGNAERLFETYLEPWSKAYLGSSTAWRHPISASALDAR